MPSSLSIVLQNDSDLSNLFAYITGNAVQYGGQRGLLLANGTGLYIPRSPPKVGSPLTEECGIALGHPGNVVHLTIPQLTGGRIWIAEGKLVFLLDPGPVLVEPGVLNPSDRNAGVNFGFCELTVNADVAYANLSYVDFVSRIPISLRLKDTSGHTQTVLGLPPNGLDEIARDMQAQTRKDHHPWDRLVVEHAGRVLRVLSPTHGTAVGANFDNYDDEYIAEVWRRFSSGSRMKINTQDGHGTLEGYVNKTGDLVIGPEFFHRPSSSDVLSCNSGPFVTGASATRNAIIPRLAAALTRTCLVGAPDQPSPPNTYYKTEETNHYARIVHAHNLDGRGYTFAYDDVGAVGAEDQSGKVNSASPAVLTVAFGGKSAVVEKSGHQMPSRFSDEPSSTCKVPYASDTASISQERASLAGLATTL